jgi:hypothetical protein
MRRCLVLAALALGSAACTNSSGTGVLAGFRGPEAVVAYTGKRPFGTGALVPLVAVAASRGDELRLINPETDLPVAAPNVAFPLAVPTLPRPVHLAATSLGDGGADALVVASGGSVVQLVATWLDGTDPKAPDVGVVATWDLEPFVGRGSQVLSLAAAPVPGGPPSGDPPVAPALAGRAWVLVGLSGGVDGQGGKLAVLELARGTGGAVELAGPPEVKVLGFEPVALAPSPDRFHLYVATRDPIPDATGRQVLGVAEIDAGGGLTAAWPARGLDGRGPTAAVAAAILGERGVAGSDFGPPVLRVYAVLDPSGCGPTQPINCGIATFDPPRGGLVVDPSTPGSVPPQAYRSPIYVPALPLAISVAMPPATGPQQCVAPLPSGEPGRCPSGFNDDGTRQQLMVLAPTSGQMWTTASMVVTAGDGNSYVLDLGRFYPTNDEFEFQSETQTNTSVSGANSIGPPSGPFLGLWFPIGTGPAPEPDADLLTLPKDLPKAFQVWPGYTPGENWALSWQGILPGLGQVAATIGRLPDGDLYLAVQAPLGNEWIVGAVVGAPELAIHPSDAWPEGDLALFRPASDATGGEVDPCPVPVANPGDPSIPHEGVIRSILPPDPVLFPGGALRLSTPPGGDLACLSTALAATPGRVFHWFASVRASGLLLVGNNLGYAGRPKIGERYALAWADEDALSGEALILARKARRIFYPWCFAAGCFRVIPGMDDLLETGPVVAFRPGVYCLDSGACTSLPVRDAMITFSTQSGMLPMGRRPLGVAAGTGAISLDKSQWSSLAYLGRVYYVTYVGDTLLMLPPGQAFNQSKTIR